MVISQPQGNNPSYYYRTSPTPASIILNALETPYMFYTCNYNIRVTHRNGAIKHIFYAWRIRSTEGSSADCSLFILSLHALALHLAVKILLQIFLWRFEPRYCHIHLSVIFHLQNASRTTCFVVQQPILLSENIPNIWHKSSTKHKEVRPDWNDKTIMQTTRLLYHMGRFYQWLRLPFLKKYSIKCEKIWTVNCFILN